MSYARRLALAFAVLATGCFDFSDVEIGNKGGWCYDDQSCDVGLACNAQEQCTDPCEQVHCSGHGACIVQNNAAACSCDADYAPVGLDCLPVGSAGTPCGPSFSCRTGVTCVDGTCVDACSALGCSPNGVCRLQNEAASCVCDDGYHENRGRCVDACDGVSCSGHGVCRIETSAVCDCDTGYQASGTTCVIPGCMPTAHASKHCDGGVLRWFDSCGGPEEVSASCGTRGCSDNACNAPVLYGLGGSDTAGLGSTSYKMSFAITASGNPVVAWSGSQSTLYITRWTGTGWASYSDQNAGSSHSLTVDSTGAPYFARTVYSTLTDVTLQNLSVKAWNTAWRAVPSDAEGVVHPGERMQSPAIALDPANTPTLAWIGEATGTNWPQVLVKQFANGAWQSLGGSGEAGISGQQQYASNPQIAFDSARRVYVLWSSSSGGGIFLKRWNGATWEELAGSGQGYGISNATNASLVVEQDAPAVAYVRRDKLVVVRWNGTQWMNVTSGIADEAGVASNIYTARVPGFTSPRANTYVAAWWSPDDDFSRVRSYMFEDGVWHPLGPDGVVHQAPDTLGIFEIQARSGGGTTCLGWQRSGTTNNNMFKCFKP